MKKPYRSKRNQPVEKNNEPICIVPLHNKPIQKKKVSSADSGSELFDGQPKPAPVDGQLTYSGGPLLTSVKVYTIFWGRQWGIRSRSELMIKLNDFFRAVVDSEFIDQLAEYSVPGKTIGRGSFIGTKIITANAPTRQVSDTAIRKQLALWIKAGVVPKNDSNTLYFIYLDSGIVSIMGSQRSCKDYCGYHNASGGVYYAVMPYPSCTGCLGGRSLFDALTGTSSHELAEAITDADPPTGWYNKDGGENADECAWTFRTLEVEVDGKVVKYVVQLLWSNKKNGCA